MDRGIAPTRIASGAYRECVTTRRSFTWSLLASALAAPVPAPSSLREAARAHNRRFGFAVNVGRLDRDPPYARTVAEQANILVAENAMKWQALRPSPSAFDFTEADRLMAFAAAHSIAIRGHNLCWHEALPSWFTAYAAPANAEQLLREHIRRVVGRYRGRVVAWDVVNEAVNPKDNRPDGLRDSPWLRLLGPRYIEIAFETARAADPQAVLYLNDYSLETDAAKRAAFLALVKRLGNRVDAVGLQSHLSADSAPRIGVGYTDFLREITALRLQAAVTELDVNDDSLPDAGRDEAVAAVYRDYLSLFLRASDARDILVWGVENKSSWLNSPGKANVRPKHPAREQHCLLFNDAFQPQPAYGVIEEALKA